MQTKIRGIRTGGSGEEVDLKASRDGDLRVAQYLPPYAMLCAAGKVFAIDTSAATAVAPDAVMPSAAAEWQIYNANSTANTFIVLLQVGVIGESGTLGLGMAIIGTTGVGAQTAGTAHYSGTVVSCLDGTAKVPNFYLVDTVTILNTQPAWVVLAAEDQSNVVAVGAGAVAKVDGMLIAPPKGSIFVSVIAPLGTSAALDITFIVAEVVLDAG